MQWVFRMYIGVISLKRKGIRLDYICVLKHKKDCATNTGNLKVIVIKLCKVDSIKWHNKILYVIVDFLDQLKFTKTNKRKNNRKKQTKRKLTHAPKCHANEVTNKANLRDLIAATGLVILLKLDLNRRFFSLIWVNIDAFLSRVTLKFDGWPSKTIGHLFYATSSFVQHFVAIGEFKLELESGNAQSGSNLMLFRAVWPWNLTDDLQKQ